MDCAENLGRVTADDVREAGPNIPFKRSVIGAAFRRLVQSGRIRLVEFQPSRHRDNHGRRIGVYKPHRIKTCLGPEFKTGVSA